MNEREQDLFEAELRQLQPAKLPDKFAERLAAAQLDVATRRSDPSVRMSSTAPWLRWLRWFAPATAIAGAIVTLVILRADLRIREADRPLNVTTEPALQADDVEIDRQLVGAFDAVATLPDGEPVRLRVREWMDEVVLRDTERGVAVQQRSPRIEVIPVSFETF